MAWTTPRTWATNELVTADMMNEQLRDNLTYLNTSKNHFFVSNTGTHSTSSASYVNVNAAFSVSMECSGGHVLVGGNFHHRRTAGSGEYLIGVRVDSQPERTVVYGNGGTEHSSFVLIFSGLTPGSHTFALRFATGNTATVQIDGTSASGVAYSPTLFWGIEL